MALKLAHVILELALSPYLGQGLGLGWTRAWQWYGLQALLSRFWWNSRALTTFRGDQVWKEGAGSICLERVAGLLKEDENQDGCSDLLHEKEPLSVIMFTMPQVLSQKILPLSFQREVASSASAFHTWLYIIWYVDILSHLALSYWPILFPHYLKCSFYLNPYENVHIFKTLFYWTPVMHLFNPPWQQRDHFCSDLRPWGICRQWPEPRAGRCSQG